MSTSIEQRENGIISIKGELTLDTVTALFDRSKALFPPQSEMIIDLSEVTHANSAGLALLLEWISWGKASETKIQFKAIPKALTAIAGLYGVKDLLS